MASSQPPSLPYARDEASTSQYISTHPYSEYYPPELIDGEVLEDEEDLAEDTVALQYWTTKKHKKPRRPVEGEEDYAIPWRLRSRLKTVNAGLFICLNIGVDPPDVVKTNPCAKLECWLDPTALPSTKAIEAIGRSQ